MKANKGFSLIEIIISMTILVIVFSMLSVIISTYYRQHIELGKTKAERETQVSNFERMLSNDSSDASIGTVKVTLETSSVPGETSDKEYNCNIVKKNYSGSKSLYVYARP